MLKAFTVFNVEQIDGLSIERRAAAGCRFRSAAAGGSTHDPERAKIAEPGVKAFYRPATDEIVLPERFRFADAANFYATGLHELNFTGRGQRPAASIVKKGNKFGSEAYAFEELIAELGSAFLMADLGITGEVQHGYIASG